jgi:hypothetical protein
MVEEMMLLANVAVASAISARFPNCSLLRRHQTPGVHDHRMTVPCQLPLIHLAALWMLMAMGLLVALGACSACLVLAIARAAAACCHPPSTHCSSAFH